MRAHRQASEGGSGQQECGGRVGEMSGVVGGMADVAHDDSGDVG
jgi:hypothetical protein